MAERNDPIVEENVNFLRDRSQVGIKKYGTTLARTDLNFEEWLQHAREEAADLLNYLTAAKNNINPWRKDTPVSGERCIIAVEHIGITTTLEAYFDGKGFEEAGSGDYYDLTDVKGWMIFPKFA